MDRLVLAMAIVVLAGAVALVARRRRRVDQPTQAAHQAPLQLDRADFTHRDAEWLLVVFTSASCDSCADVVAKASVAASDAVGFVEVEFGAQRELHRRYGIDAVPTLVLADRDGVVLTSSLGRVTATDLWASIARAREPGRDMPGCC